MDCMRFGSLLVTSLIQAPGKQQTSLGSGSGQQMGAPIPLLCYHPLPFLSSYGEQVGLP